MRDKHAPVAIVGGGAWGLSTALHLQRTGYTDITVFERAEQIPSPYSAAWDVNKIVRAEYEDPFYTERALVCPHHQMFLGPSGWRVVLSRQEERGK